MKPSLILFLVSLCNMFLCTSALAQNEEELQDSAEVPETQDNESEIEQIIVQGERTRFALRMEIERAETDVYNLFNELNSNDDFDVTCEEIVYTGSLIPQRTCMAAFLREEMAYQTQTFVQSIPLGDGLGAPGGGVLLDFETVQGEVRQKAEAMEQEMIRLAVENPDFAAMLVRLSRLIGLLEERDDN